MRALWMTRFLSRKWYFLSESVFNPHRQKRRRTGEGENWEQIVCANASVIAIYKWALNLYLYLPGFDICQVFRYLNTTVCALNSTLGSEHCGYTLERWLRFSWSHPSTTNFHAFDETLVMTASSPLSKLRTARVWWRGPSHSLDITT